MSSGTRTRLPCYRNQQHERHCCVADQPPPPHRSAKELHHRVPFDWKDSPSNRDVGMLKQLLGDKRRNQYGREHARIDTPLQRPQESVPFEDEKHQDGTRDNEDERCVDIALDQEAERSGQQQPVRRSRLPGSEKRQSAGDRHHEIHLGDIRPRNSHLPQLEHVRETSCIEEVGG